MSGGRTSGPSRAGNPQSTGSSLSAERPPRDENLEDSDNLPPPEVFAAEIVEDLQAALDRFAQIATDLNPSRPAAR